jgi:hypothetical protein
MLEQQVDEHGLVGAGQPRRKQEVGVTIGEVGCDEGAGLARNRVPLDPPGYIGREDLSEETRSVCRSLEAGFEEGIVGLAGHGGAGC